MLKVDRRLEVKKKGGRGKEMLQVLTGW